MATKRALDAYRRRLQRIGEQVNPGAALTAECLYAVVTFVGDVDEPPVTGTLVSYTHRLGQGLFGPRIMTDLTVCTDCAHRKGRCGPEFEQSYSDVAVLDVVRNGDREAS